MPISYTVNEEDLTEQVFVELNGLETSRDVVVTVSTGGEGDTAIGKDVLYMLGVTYNTINSQIPAITLTQLCN